jgi:hypothetical protein
MTRDELLRSVVDAARADARVCGLFLGGSLATGHADAFSDVDLVLAVNAEAHPAFVEQIRAWIAALVELVLWKQPYPTWPLFNAVTTEWLRLDLTVTVPERLTGSKATLKPLVDPRDLYGGLPDRLPAREVDPAKVVALTEEFLRICGMAPIALGRAEYVVGVTGAGLLRGLLIDLLIEELALPRPPGALHLSRLLSAEDVAMLAALPAATASADGVLAANLACAGAFLPRARALAARTGAPWPSALEAAARARLEQALGVTLP